MHVLSFVSVCLILCTVCLDFVLDFHTLTPCTAPYPHPPSPSPLPYVPSTLLCHHMTTTVLVLDSESDEDERQQPDKNELQLMVRTLASKLEDLNTCNDLIAKHGSALQKTLSELEQVDDSMEAAGKLKAVNERATLFRITSNAMINVSCAFCHGWVTASVQDHLQCYDQCKSCIFFMGEWLPLFTITSNAMINVSCAVCHWWVTATVHDHLQCYVQCKLCSLSWVSDCYAVQDHLQCYDQCKSCIFVMGEWLPLFSITSNAMSNVNHAFCHRWVTDHLRCYDQCKSYIFSWVSDCHTVQNHLRITSNAMINVSHAFCHGWVADHLQCYDQCKSCIFSWVSDCLSLVIMCLPQDWQTWGWYHGGRRPSSEDSLHSPTIIPPSALDKPSIMKRYHRRWTTRWGVTAHSPVMVMLYDTQFVKCRWWKDSWTVKTVVTWQSWASMIPARGFDSNFPLGPSSWLSHTSDTKIATPVATWQGMWLYGVSTWTGLPGVSIVWLGEIANLICNFYFSIAVCTIVWVDSSLRYTSMLLRH